MFTELTDVNLNVFAGLSIDNNGYIQINGIQLDADFQHVQLDLESLNLEGSLSESISRFISR